MLKERKTDLCRYVDTKMTNISVKLPVKAWLLFFLFSFMFRTPNTYFCGTIP